MADIDRIIIVINDKEVSGRSKERKIEIPWGIARDMANLLGAIFHQ